MLAVEASKCVKVSASPSLMWLAVAVGARFAASKRLRAQSRLTLWYCVQASGPGTHHCWQCLHLLPLAEHVPPSLLATLPLHRQLGKAAGVRVPLHSAEHFYVITDPIPGVHGDLPIMRDTDAYL